MSDIMQKWVYWLQAESGLIVDTIDSTSLIQAATQDKRLWINLEGAIDGMMGEYEAEELEDLTGDNSRKQERDQLWMLLRLLGDESTDFSDDEIFEPYRIVLTKLFANLKLGGSSLDELSKSTLIAQSECF